MSKKGIKIEQLEDTEYVDPYELELLEKVRPLYQNSYFKNLLKNGPNFNAKEQDFLIKKAQLYKKPKTTDSLVEAFRDYKTGNDWKDGL